ncbi:MAG: NAD(P)H-hydrate dehydratase [Bacteroidales bacterium]|nr:NAD(P)H-hydrate dehydratase [Bacteroidales bacterium]MBP5614124.1 NAD(P)H-hydrate dehydratase [Bacteroidales bacterium]
MNDSLPFSQETASRIGWTLDGSCQLVEKKMVSAILRPRAQFAHKGDFGHALLIAGSRGMLGACQLAAKACLRGGVGLLTVHLPACGELPMQTAVPEAMLSCDVLEDTVSSLDFRKLEKYSAVGIGPGLGRSAGASQCLKQLLQFYRRPIVCDADALNLFSENPTWLEFLPAGSILTPHPGELERLIGRTVDATERLERTRNFAARHRCVCLVKGAYTAVVLPDGHVFFNTTGNPGMATAGSGDVLCGLILALLAQGYAPEHAAIAGVFLHGLAGDLALEFHSEESLCSGDLPDYFGAAFKAVRG